MSLFFIGIFILNNIFNYGLTIPFVLIFTVLLFFIIGIFDDLFSVNPFFRLIFQFLISLIAWNFGMRLEFINLNYSALLNSYPFELPLFSIIITTLGIAGLTNAINWLDGLDGLAASFSSIVFFIFGIIFTFLGDLNLSLLCFCSMGSCIGFLKYNFFPSKIFMGDGGSYLLGSLLACLTIQLNLSINNNLLKISENTFPLITFLIFLIPVLDMIIVVLSRVKNRISPFYPDKSHLHHKLKNIGFNARDIVFINASTTQLLGFSILLGLGISNSFTIINAFSFILFLTTIMIYFFKIR